MFFFAMSGLPQGKAYQTNGWLKARDVTGDGGAPAKVFGGRVESGLTQQAQQELAQVDAQRIKLSGGHWLRRFPVDELVDELAQCS